MKDEAIPRWALDEAARRLNEAIGWSCYNIRSSETKVLARVIAKHEKPPVDPDEEALERILNTVGVRRAYGREEWYEALAQYKKEIGRD